MIDGLPDVKAIAMNSHILAETQESNGVLAQPETSRYRLHFIQQAMGDPQAGTLLETCTEARASN
jgi:hypothetical protein